MAAALAFAQDAPPQAAVPNAAPAAETRPNLLLITLDTTRADEIAPWGPGGVAPNLDALAAESLVAAVARAPAPLTLPSHTSMMTGLFPFAHGVRDNDLYRLSPKAATVAALLREGGWRTEAVVAATVLRAASGLDLGFEKYDDLRLRRARNLALEAERPANEITDRALARLAAADPRPWFLWLHYFDPHSPYAAPDPPPPSAGRRAAYEAEVRFMDREIGRLLAALRVRPDFGRTWIVVSGDHGEGLGLQQELTHAFLCEEGTLRVPLFVRNPGGALRGRLEMPASTADVGATLLAAARLSFPGAVHGRDLVAAFAAEERSGSDADAQADRALWFESWAGYHQFRWARLEGVVAGRFKLVKNVANELFDLSSPEGERKNLVVERPEVVRALLARFEQVRSDPPIVPLDAAAPPMEPAEAARLRELGYFSRMVAEDDERERGTLDPRVHYASYVNLDLATTLARQGRFDESLKMLRKLCDDYPKNPSFREFLGRACVEAHRPDEAQAAFEQALALDPDLVTASFYLGALRRSAGDAAGARKHLEHALSLAPGHLEARLQLRAVHDDAKEYAAVLADCVAILAVCDEMGDDDGAKLAANTLDEWLPGVCAKLAAAPDRRAILEKARAQIASDGGPSSRRAAERLDAELAHGR
jgi:arylsulfatase A-like enzyme